MALQRWKFGSYTLKYNPKSDERSLKVVDREQMSVNGMITNPNLFFNNDIDLVIDLYDKPTYYDNSPISTFSLNTYVDMSEKTMTSELFCLKSGAVDVRNRAGAVVKTIPYSYVGTPAGIAHLDNKIALLFKSGNQGILAIIDENGSEISKYTISDVDYSNASSITWDYSNGIYVLNKYGKIMRTAIGDGATSLLYQSSDYAENQAANTFAYRGIHIFNGFIGFIKNNRTLTYLNDSLEVIYGNDLPAKATIGNNVAISYGLYSKEFYLLSDKQIIKLYPNVCGVDIEKIKKEMANGIVIITNESGQPLNAIIRQVSVKKLRNKQDARYEVSLSGQIV